MLKHYVKIGSCGLNCVEKLSPFSWTFGGSSRWNGIGRFCDDPMNKTSNAVNGAKASHCSTVERLYAWEKKLYLEVKVNNTEVPIFFIAKFQSPKSRVRAV